MLNDIDFLNTVKKHINVNNEKLLLEAYHFAKDAHKDQKRDGGDPYFVHPLQIALEISEYKLDENSIIAGLLHDVVEDSGIKLKDIEKKFGKEVAYMVDGLTKIENVKFQSRTEKNAENFRKLILTTAKDIRVLIIKLIDRLNNMQTISGIGNKERRTRIAEETLLIYVPLAERIGMYKMKLELEDLCFEELLPNERADIISKLKKIKKNQKNIIDDIVKKLTLDIKFENNISCKITGREKKPYSIWKKMHKKSVSFEKIMDIIAFRIIVKNIGDCYKTLGCINSNYIMIPNTFDDYINKPKSNGYQSIHMAIIGPKNIKIEVQIRTEEMNRIAEYGVASHWMYKQNISREKELQEYNVLQTLIQNLENSSFSTENFEDLKYEIYEDQIFCYTPKGDIINLPVGSTGIDFAYAIHRDIGNHCCGVKINGNLSQFKTKLNSGDEVDILTSKTTQVNEDWLEFVKTAKAKAEIKAYIRNSRLDEFEKIGREDIKHFSKSYNVVVTDDLIEKNLANLNQGKTVPEVYALIAQGKIKKKEFLKILFPNLEKENPEEESKLKIRIKSNEETPGIQGFDKNIAYKYAKCCYPIPPEEIVGVVNSGTGITVHRNNCPVLKNIQDQRIIDLEWDTNTNSKYVAKVTIVFDSTPGVFAKVVNLCAEKKINIIGINTLNESSSYQEVDMKIEVKNAAELENFRASVRGIPGILEVKN